MSTNCGTGGDVDIVTGNSSDMTDPANVLGGLIAMARRKADCPDDWNFIHAAEEMLAPLIFRRAKIALDSDRFPEKGHSDDCRCWQCKR
jgi:hypothetical protein